MNELQLSDEELDGIVDRALAEDAGHGDITTAILVPPELYAQALMLAGATGVVAGAGVAARVFQRVDSSLKFEIVAPDGNSIRPGQTIAVVSGKAASILCAERTALNFIQRLSGIASMTARYVEAVEGSRAMITDTRKTTPGLRLLEKYAVSVGGGRNHRLHLGDGILIKDNHIASLRALGMGLKDIVTRAKQNAPAGMAVEVEVTTSQEAREVLEAGADIILLDNMDIDEMRRSVELIGGQARIEASGGITLDNVRQVSMTGVDIISIGALTHSARALDISLEFEPQTLRLI